MELLKKTITKLEDDVSELKQFKTKIQGSMPSRGDIHYCTGAQEFGEYDLNEIDTFRFLVLPGPANFGGISNGPSPKAYRYTLINSTYAIGDFTTDVIPVDIENFEKFIMKSGNLTEVQRKDFQSKLWSFAIDLTYGNLTIDNLSKEFYTDISIPFTHTYKISPHVSFYITPLSNTLDECVIHEITTKQVVFRIKYGNLDNINKPIYKKHIYSGLKLHYSISGVVEQNENLLD